MFNLKKSILILFTAGQLAGCASPGNQVRLNVYKQACAGGSATDCAAVPLQENVNRAEATNNALKVAAVAVLLPLVVLAAMADAREPVYVVRRCWLC